MSDPPTFGRYAEMPVDRMTIAAPDPELPLVSDRSLRVGGTASAAS